MSNKTYKIARQGQPFAEVDEAGLVDGLKSGRFLPTDHCWSVGFAGWQRVDQVVQRLSSAQPSPRPAPSPSPSNAGGGSAPRVVSQGAPAPGADVSSLIPHLWGVFAAGAALFLGSQLINRTQWDYSVQRVMTEQVADRTGTAALRYSSIDSDELQKVLRARGLEGWEVVAVSLEMETAWPNFGSGEYVTGLQPNIRPQSLIVVLKRRRPLL